MRHLLLVLFVFSALIIVNGQSVDFAPVGAKWWINQILVDPILADSFVIVEVTGEEMKEGQLCRVISNLSGCGLPNPAYVFTRNDSVFFFSEVTEQFELLYDYTAVAGSSWTVRGLSNFDGLDHIVNVLNVNEEEWHGKILKTWYIQNSEIWGDRIFEKVGSLWYLGPTYREYCPTEDESRKPHMVRCYEDAEGLIKFASVPCDYWYGFSSTSDFGPVVDLHLYPNPTLDQVIIELGEGRLQNQSLHLVVSSITGENMDEMTLSSNLTHYSFSVGGFPAGLYFVRLYNNAGHIIGVGKLAIGMN